MLDDNFDNIDNTGSEPFVGGFIRQKPDPKDFKIATIYKLFGIKEPAKLPTKVDLRAKCSPIVDQGQLGSCTANAGSGLVDFCENKQGYGFLVGSRLLLYYNTRVKIEKNPAKQDTGCTIRGTLKSLGTYGICKEPTWPYIISKFGTAPNKTAVGEAANYRALTYALVDQPGMSGTAVLTAIKQQLVNGIPMEFGFDVFDSYSQASRTGAFPYPSKNENRVGGHAILCVGFDDSKVITNTIDKTSTKGAFLIRNSWGTGWGEKGYGWLPYDYVTKNFQGTRLATDFWVLLSEAWKK